MDTIGVVTLIDYLNYGNRLQNYAVQEVLHALGYNSYTLIFENKELYEMAPFAKRNGLKLKARYIIWHIKQFIKKIYVHLLMSSPSLSVLWPRSFNRRKDIFRTIRKNKFDKFTKDYINTKKLNTADNVKEEIKLQAFLAFVIRSDQV